jgi:hypothetical protein
LLVTIRAQPGRLPRVGAVARCRSLNRFFGLRLGIGEDRASEDASAARRADADAPRVADDKGGRSAPRPPAEPAPTLPVGIAPIALVAAALRSGVPRRPSVQGAALHYALWCAAYTPRDPRTYAARVAGVGIDDVVRVAGAYLGEDALRVYLSGWLDTPWPLDMSK